MWFGWCAGCSRGLQGAIEYSQIVELEFSLGEHCGASQQRHPANHPPQLTECNVVVREMAYTQDDDICESYGED
jgi:hypothetical protein